MGTFVFILLFSFGVVTLIIVLHNKNSAQKLKGSQTRKNGLYYDKVAEQEEAEQQKRCCGLVSKFKDMVSKQRRHKEEDEVTYQDLENLLGEFKQQMEVLKAKMREDHEGDDEGSGEEEGDNNNDEEEELIKELNALREFVNNNKICIEDFFGIKREVEQRDNEDEDDVKSLNLDE